MFSFLRDEVERTTQPQLIAYRNNSTTQSSVMKQSDFLMVRIALSMSWKNCRSAVCPLAVMVTLAGALTCPAISMRSTVLGAL